MEPISLSLPINLMVSFGFCPLFNFPLPSTPILCFSGFTDAAVTRRFAIKIHASHQMETHARRILLATSIFNVIFLRTNHSPREDHQQNTNGRQIRERKKKKKNSTPCFNNFFTRLGIVFRFTVFAVVDAFNVNRRSLVFQTLQSLLFNPRQHTDSTRFWKSRKIHSSWIKVGIKINPTSMCKRLK